MYVESNNQCIQEHELLTVDVFILHGKNRLVEL